MFENIFKNKPTSILAERTKFSSVNTNGEVVSARVVQASKTSQQYKVVHNGVHIANIDDTSGHYVCDTLAGCRIYEGNCLETCFDIILDSTVSYDTWLQ